MRRTFAISVCLLLLTTLVGMLNHSLSGAHLYVFVGALYVSYAALQVPFREGLLAVMIGGLLLDANTPVSFGTHTLLFAASHAVIYNLRDRLPRDDTISRVVITLLLNLPLFLVFSFFQIGNSPHAGSLWGRLGFDLLCSQVVLALVTPWFFALQAHAIRLTGTDERGML